MTDPAAAKKPNGNGAAHAPPSMTLPYADFSHALIRAHHDAHAMANVNRILADSLRDVLRRQQDLAFELTEAALTASKSGALSAPAQIFDRAAQAVREVGEAIIDAQIEALKQLQAEAEPRAAFAFPPLAAPEAVKATRPEKPKAEKSAGEAGRNV